MYKILYFASTLGVFLTPFATAAPLCQSPLVATTQRGSAEGSAKILFLCEGVVINELSGFSTPRPTARTASLLSCTRRKVMMIRNYICSQLMQMGYQIISDQLALLAGVTAYLSLGTRIPRDFSSFAEGATDQLTGLAKNSAIITLSQKGRRWQASLRVISEGMGLSKSVLS